MSALYLVMRHHSRALGPEFLCPVDYPHRLTVDWGRIDEAESFDEKTAAAWVKRLGGRAVPS